MTLRQLAARRGEAGDPVASATIFEGVLADRRRVIGDNHPDTVETRKDLEYWRQRSG